MNKATARATAIALGTALLCGVLEGAPAGDAESPTHGDRAASYELIKTYAFPGFKVLQFKLGVLSHYSYVLESRGEALVVDPGRDVFACLDAAKEAGAEVKGVFLTHSHADFVAGHIECARRTGCPIYISASSGAEFPFEPLREGSAISVGDARIRFVETPGHTPDGMCGYAYGAGRRGSPGAIFTGDTLFVGSVGRPDLLEGTLSAAALASMMFDTWTRKLSKTGDDSVILPAHGAGSLCGAHLSDSPSSTIGAEKETNPYFQNRSRSEFIAAVLDGLPEAPQYFAHVAKLNRTGPELVEWNAPPPPETRPDDSLTDPARCWVVDVRSAKEYASGHIPGSVNIGVRGRFENWTGTMVPWGANLVLCGSEDELKEALYRLHRVGYHAGVITPGHWKKAGKPLEKSELVTPAALYREMKHGSAPVIVDVRMPPEVAALRIGNVVNLPLTHLAELSGKLDPSQPVVTVCNSAYRSSMAVGILQRKGFSKVSNMEGGSEGWVKAGLPVHGARAHEGATAAAAPEEGIRLPESVSPADMSRMLKDGPGAFEIVDIRPPAQYADYRLPGSKNVSPRDLLADPAYLSGGAPLVIVDSDGARAMAVAGILSQKTARPLKALEGGLRAYWKHSMLPRLEGEPPAAHGGASAPTAPQGEATPRPEAKRSAGC